MQHLSIVEEELRSLAIEAVSKKRNSHHTYPEIKESADKALHSLKYIREDYVRRRGKSKERIDISSASQPENSTFEISILRGSGSLPRCSDIVAPYILACNYAEGSTKLLTMALNGIHNILNFDMVPPQDVKNILRVLSIQAGGSVGVSSSSVRLQPESQLKILQISLQMINFLSSSLPHATSSEHLNDQTLFAFLSLALQLCDQRNNVSVTSAAFGTARQIISLVFEEANYHYCAMEGLRQESTGNEPSNELKARLYQGATALLREICFLLTGQQGELVVSGNLQRNAVQQLHVQQFALDLLGEIALGWDTLLLGSQPFRQLVSGVMLPAIIPLVRSLVNDHVVTATRHGLVAGMAHTGRVMRLARCLLLKGLSVSELLPSLETLLVAVTNCLQPEWRNLDKERDSMTGSKPSGQGYLSPPPPTGQDNESFGLNLRTRLEEASSLLLLQGGAGTIMSRLGLGSSAASTPSGSASSSAMKAQSAGGAPINIAGFYITLRSPRIPNSASSPPYGVPSGPAGDAAVGPSQQLPTYPALVCLEALIAVLAQPQLVQLAETDGGVRLLELILVHAGVCSSQLVNAALSYDSNARCRALSLPLTLPLSSRTVCRIGTWSSRRCTRR